MIKLIFILALGLALNERSEAEVLTAKEGSDGYGLSVDLDDTRCCESKCLDKMNSEKIGRTILYIISANKDQAYVLASLKIIEYVYEGLSYEEFSENIKNNDFEFYGYKTLKQLVSRYQSCGGENEVSTELDKALNEFTTGIVMYPEDIDETTKTLVVEGEFIVLSHISAFIIDETAMDSSFVRIFFVACTFIADISLENMYWHGLHVDFQTDNFLVVQNIVWDFRGLVDENTGELTEPDGSIYVDTLYYDQRDYTLEVYPM